MEGAPVPPARESARRWSSNVGCNLATLLFLLAVLAFFYGSARLQRYQSDRRTAERFTSQHIAALAKALERLEQPDQMGRYPPTSTRRLPGWSGEANDT